MKQEVCFRDFEERDIDFIYACKNDEKLNSLIVGQFKSFSHEDAERWVKGVIRADRKDMRFWAVCTNDEEKRIVGWASLSNIDLINKTAFYHGIVIGDPEYRDGFAWIETCLFIYDYTFEVLKLNKVYGEALTDHITSQTMRKIMYANIIEVKKQAIKKNGEYHDISVSVLTSDDYFEHKTKGDYEISAILKHLRQIKKTK